MKSVIIILLLINSIFSWKTTNSTIPVLELFSSKFQISMDSYYQYYEGFLLLKENINSYFFKGNSDDLITYELQSPIAHNFEHIQNLHNKKRLLNSSTILNEYNIDFTDINTPTKPILIECNKIGKELNATEIIYFCFDNEIPKKQYEYFAKRNATACTTKKEEIKICYCPKDYEGEKCKNHIKTVCGFTKLYLNEKNLLEGLNTFYDEYTKRNLIYLDDRMNFNMKVKCRTSKNRPESYTYTNINKDIIVDSNITNQIKFDYFYDNNKVTLSNTPEMKFLFKFYDMKNLSPEIIFYKNFTLNNTIYELLNGDLSIDYNIDFNNIQTVDGKTIKELEKLVLAGRLFYELELRDFKNESIQFIHYQGQIEMKGYEFKEKNEEDLWIYLLILGIILVAGILVCCFLYKKKKKENSGQVFDDNSKRY